MNLRQRRAYRRTSGTSRTTVGALVISGVLVAAGLTGVGLASAQENTTAAGVVVIEGQEFDVSACETLEIAAGEVLCDGEPIAPVENGAEAEAALEAACDEFALGQAGDGGGAEDDAEAEPGTTSRTAPPAEDEEGAEDAAVTDARDALFLACLELADAKAAAGDGGAGDDGGAEDDGAEGGADDAGEEPVTEE